MMLASKVADLDRADSAAREDLAGAARGRAMTITGRRGFDINHPHGSIYYGIGDSALNAAPYALAGEPATNPAYVQNSFGGSIGGPLNIPKIYHGGTKTFFFVNYNGQARGESFRSVFDGSDAAGAARKLFADHLHFGPREGTTSRDIQSRDEYSLREQYNPADQFRRGGIASLHTDAESSGRLSEFSFRDLRDQ